MPISTHGRRSSWSTSRTISPTRPVPCMSVVASTCRPHRCARHGGARCAIDGGLHPGLAPADRRRISPRTAASGRSIACRDTGARRCTPDSTCGVPSCARGPMARTATAASRCATRSPAEPCRPSWPGSWGTGMSSGSSICGLATDYCVGATALDARGLGLPHDRAARPGPRRRPRPWRRRADDRASMAAAAVQLEGD